MKRLRSLLLCGLLGGAIVQAGCGRPTYVVAHYSGPVQPRETLGVVRVNGDESLELLALDGESANARVAEDARLHIEILPGNHTVWVQDANLRDVPAQRVRFTAEAGKVYRPVFVSVNGRPAPRVYQVDASSDALLKDVTLAEIREPSPSSSAPRPEPQQPNREAAPAAPPAPGPSPPPNSEATPAPPAAPLPGQPSIAPEAPAAPRPSVEGAPRSPPLP